MQETDKFSTPATFSLGNICLYIGVGSHGRCKHKDEGHIFYTNKFTFHDNSFILVLTVMMWNSETWIFPRIQTS